MKITPEFFDTLSEVPQSLPLVSKKKPLHLFVCGPTVYDVLHIGNGRTYLIFDSFVRYLRSSGIPVFYLQNITDIDDKIIAKATKENTTAKEVAKKYQKIYLRNMKQLGITEVTTYAPATKFVPQIISQVERLIKKGFVYKTEDGYYFDLATFPDYGKLARRTATQAEDGVSRIDDGVEKRNRGDFCVWKFSKPGEPTWKAKIGNGRPGWHIEDTAITEHFFGPQYDIHGGGVDIKFPHHEAEIAQQESASGKKPFVKIWMHVGALRIDGKKMSKSLGNFVSIDDFLKSFEPEVLRLIALSNHYRSPIHYTSETPKTYTQSWKNITSFIAKLEFVEKSAKKSQPEDMREAVIEKETLESQFHKALSNDFNTPQALAAIFECMNTIQPKVWQLSKKEATLYRKTIISLLGTLGFKITLKATPQKIKTLLAKRAKAKTHQQFMQSDELRKQINELGYNLEDTPLGQFVRPQ